MPQVSYRCQIWEAFNGGYGVAESSTEAQVFTVVRVVRDRLPSQTVRNPLSTQIARTQRRFSRKVLFADELRLSRVRSTEGRPQGKAPTGSLRPPDI